MKKKSVIIIAVSAFVLVAIAMLLIFVFSGNSMDDMKAIELNGTWKVAAYFSNGSPTLPENEYMIFNDDTATAYRDGATIATSTYSLTGGTILELSDISRQYTIERRTDNYIRLYESSSVYMELIRYPKEDLSSSSVDKSKLYDSWKVSYRNTDTPITDETLVFTENEIKDYRNGSDDPAAVSSYTWTKSDCLLAEKWGIEFQLVQLSDNTILFIETKSGLIWELNRAS